MPGDTLSADLAGRRRVRQGAFDHVVVRYEADGESFEHRLEVVSQGGCG